jgi:REP element-mobilizing transposase RayT
MPRRLRVHVPGGFYHVTLRGNHQKDIFFDDGDRCLLNKIVARAIETFEARAHAYCWMSNHLHLLLQIGAEPLARPMRQIAAEYARAMQLGLGTTGHFFERRYHANLVNADSYLLELVRYIHLNPVRAGIADSPSAFRWSSHHAYIGAGTDSWITTDFVLQMFGSEPSSAVMAYRKFLDCVPEQIWAPPTEISSSRAPARAPLNPPSRASTSGRQALPDLIAEACQRFNVDSQQINSPVRNTYLVKVRAWIAHQAAIRGVATLSAVARALGRDEATLRYAIRAYPGELD